MDPVAEQAARIAGLENLKFRICREGYTGPLYVKTKPGHWTILVDADGFDRFVVPLGEGRHLLAIQEISDYALDLASEVAASITGAQAQGIRDQMVT
jgi:hypothetical protein